MRAHFASRLLALLVGCVPYHSWGASPALPVLALTTFDDQNPNMFGYTGQVTLAGYDNMTGLGTPNGQAFINALK